LLALSRLPDDIRWAALRSIEDNAVARLAYTWEGWARDDQLAPGATETGAAWRTWLVLGGRGAGKTRAGAEWVRARALGAPHSLLRARRIALVGETIGQVRSVMIEGLSGLLSIHAPHERPKFEVSRNELLWPNGTIAQMFAADDPDSLRGPQFDAAWCDELCKWRRPERAWDNLQFALRLGLAPQCVVTTTPRPIALLTQIMNDATTVTNRSRTADNAANLAPAFLAEMQRRYADTPIGRQELEGEIVEDRMNGLWKRHWLSQARLAARPELRRIVVAVDPPVTSSAGADSCGIVVAGLGVDGRGYVIGDRTIQGRDPATWAHAAVAAYHDYQADRIVVETNQGGDLVVQVFKGIDANLPVKKVHASRGKYLRAEPISALYAEGRVAHVGEFPELERQMCDFAADGLSNGKSPDRLDALVWALTELMLTSTRKPVIRPL
jgi:phage terminase large subunit-like protein